MKGLTVDEQQAFRAWREKQFAILQVRRAGLASVVSVLSLIGFFVVGHASMARGPLGVQSLLAFLWCWRSFAKGLLGEAPGPSLVEYSKWQGELDLYRYLPPRKGPRS